MAKKPILIAKSSPRSDAQAYFYTKGGELSLDGVEYIGEYHIMNGYFYTGPIQEPGSRLLRRFYSVDYHYRYEQLFNFLVPAAQYRDPAPFTFTPTEQQYASGFATRYFVEKINDEESFAVEIDAPQFGKLGKAGGIDSGLYTNTTVEWKLTGTPEAILLHNEQEMLRAQLVVPSVLFCVTSYTEYGRVTENQSGSVEQATRRRYSFPTKADVRQSILAMSLLSSSMG